MSKTEPVVYKNSSQAEVSRADTESIQLHYHMIFFINARKAQR